MGGRFMDILKSILLAPVMIPYFIFQAIRWAHYARKKENE